MGKTGDAPAGHPAKKHQMIPTLLFLILRRYCGQDTARLERIRTLARDTARRVFLLLLLVAIGLVAEAQDIVHQYLVRRKGKDIGVVELRTRQEGSRYWIRAESVIMAWAVVMVTVRTSEESRYENGILVYSSVIRRQNGREKVNQQTRLNSKRYIIHDGDSTIPGSTGPIRYSMLNLYLREPVAEKKVYSDIYRCLLDIETIGEHHYRIRFPDGNYNEYFYEGGICSRVMVYHKRYQVSIVRKG